MSGVVVAGVLVRSDRVLAAQRPDGKNGAGMWEFPGGKREQGETDRQALVRELQEELGVTVTVGAHLGSSPIHARDRLMELRAYACTLEGGEPAALEHAALRWLKKDELEGLPWCPADQSLLGAVAELLR